MTSFVHTCIPHTTRINVINFHAHMYTQPYRIYRSQSLTLLKCGRIAIVYVTRSIKANAASEQQECQFDGLLLWICSCDFLSVAVHSMSVGTIIL